MQLIGGDRASFVSYRSNNCKRHGVSFFKLRRLTIYRSYLIDLSRIGVSGLVQGG